MRLRPAGRGIQFSAVQTIDLRRPQFKWFASVGPFGAISVLDALKTEEGLIEVRAFRWLRIAQVKGGAALTKGELMRYLAELAWAPDAILSNRFLDWDIIDDRRLRVSASAGGVRGAVELRLDDDGRIESVYAPDRPRKEGSEFVERPWQGRFLDYRMLDGRWLPYAGEVGWLIDGQISTAWRGEVRHWQIV